MTEETKRRVVEPRQAGLPVLEREALRAAAGTGVSTCWPAAGRGLLLRGWPRGPASSPAAPPAAAACCACAIAACDCWPSSLLRLDRELVEEGRRAEDDGARRRAAAIAAHGAGRRLAADHLAARRLARQAALERQQPPEVAGQQELAQVALDEDLDRLVAELVVEALGRRVGAGAAVDQRVGLRSASSRSAATAPIRVSRTAATITGVGRSTARPAIRARSSSSRQDYGALTPARSSRARELPVRRGSAGTPTRRGVASEAAESLSPSPAGPRSPRSGTGRRTRCRS